MCDTLLYSVVDDFINYSCMSGVDAKRIPKSIRTPQIEKTLLNYDALWYGDRKTYESFMNDSKNIERVYGKNGCLKL